MPRSSLSLASITALSVVSIGFSVPVRAQTGNLVINGDFENVVGTGCNSNLGNGAVGGVLPTLTAFGTANEIDVYTSMPCWGLSAFSGNTKMAISTQTATAVDAFSFGLSSPILSGTSYTLSFAAHAVADFNNFPGTVDVGISNDPLSFGTLVHSASLSTYLVWDTYSTTFFAPMNAQYLTVQAAGTVHAWTHIDAFVLTGQNSAEFCAGDGTNTPCPCGNDSPVGANTGCLNSLATGGRLRALGNPSLSADSFVLVGNQMPNASALYLQGTTQTSGGSGTLLGDGLRCVSGTIVRLGVKGNVAGASQYPQAGDIPISLRGLIGAPGIRTYQAWYRNSATFCTPALFNLTNGIEVTWGT